MHTELTNGMAVPPDMHVLGALAEVLLGRRLVYQI